MSLSSHSISSLKYLDPPVLREWFNTGSPTGTRRFLVIDVRDSDHIGGHIRDSHHQPSNALTDSVFSALVTKAEPYSDIVFHCALSQQRGPSAALKFMRSGRPGQLDGKKVWVLRGGFVKWQELYGEDDSVTDAYQKDIWKYGY